MITPLSDTFVSVKLHIKDDVFIVGTGDSLGATRAKVNELIDVVNRLELELKALKETK